VPAVLCALPAAVDGVAVSALVGGGLEEPRAGPSAAPAAREEARHEVLPARRLHRPRAHQHLQPRKQTTSGVAIGTGGLPEMEK
jgi:hypothetical protein